MRWDERQQAMLRGLGLRLWLPETPAGASADEAATAAVTPQTAAAQAGPAQDAGAPLAQPLRSAPPPRAAAAHGPALAPGDARAVPGPSATPGGIAGMDWPALREAVAGCQACGLCRTRRHTVFGVGHEQAQLMVVGEAPGEQEDRQGEPFVGAAGQLLDRMLAALGLTRDAAEPARQVFIANTLKCRPPHNRNPAPDELAQCQPFLERQVALVQPRVILAMGRFAVQSLLGSDAPIGRLRGSVHQWQGRPLVVTYHPAYLLRQPADKARAWDDLCLAAELLQPPAA